jgi:hypothetical protein
MTTKEKMKAIVWTKYGPQAVCPFNRHRYQ